MMIAIVKNIFGRSLLGAVMAAAMLSTIAAVAAPDLTPFQPPNWSGKIVVAPAPNLTNYTGSLYSTNSLYLAWAVQNTGSSENAQFDVEVLVDGQFSQEWQAGPLPQFAYVFVTNYFLGALSAGSHTVAVIADVGQNVSGDIRTNSAYTNTIAVNPVLLPAPAAYTPANGSVGQITVPWFSWAPVTSATSYRILIATKGADLPASPTATSGGSSVVINATTLTPNFSPTIQLNSNATYFWEVHAQIDSQDNATWSGIQRFSTGSGGSGITIIPTFDSSITSDPQAAAIEATIKAAISTYHQDFSDPITARFEFLEMADGLGDNSAGLAYIPYSDYLDALASHATTPDDATALANLPPGDINPVNGNQYVNLKYPLLRALGYSIGGQAEDASIYLNTSIMNLSSFETDSNQFSLFATVSHEMDEALGFGSLLNGLANGAAVPTGPIQPEDLFRYAPNGARSFTTAAGATAYFSLDGSTHLAQFNQFDGGDFGDWYSYNATVTPAVQDAFLQNGVNPVLNVELRGLDAIGFTRVMPATKVVVAQLSGMAFIGGSFQFVLNGLVGSNYVVQISSNLLTWAPLSTNTVPSSGAVTITNTPGAQSRRFYRAILH